MEKTYTVKITSQAEEQIQEIIHYITYELKAPEAALHLLTTLENSFTSLSHFPQRIALIDELPWRAKGIHRLPVKNFLIYFWIDEDNMKVQITAVIYEKRNQLRQLAEMDVE
ncbi:MAG: type II toxin-antitoxin system RelE/ParE family toxin [Blautia sp.]|nr:type II toxin-antitoxin system RelE/ParE family toxin [Lachnoclostridium sp.]MCM1212544.1 type II toxin-antitoxin system RelE/ParE family toxin [Blautia sp.]